MKVLKGIFAVVLLLVFLCGVIGVIVYNAEELLHGALLMAATYLIFIFFVGCCMSKKDSIYDRIKDGIALVFSEIANVSAKVSYEVGTPAEEKRRVEAEEFHDSMLNTMRNFPTHYTPESFYDNFEAHQKRLKVLNIDRDKWLQEAYPIWYKSFLDKAFYAKDCPAILGRIEVFDKEEKIQETLKYFGISQEEWDNKDPKILQIISEQP